MRRQRRGMGDAKTLDCGCKVRFLVVWILLLDPIHVCHHSCSSAALPVLSCPISLSCPSPLSKFNLSFLTYYIHIRMYVHIHPSIPHTLYPYPYSYPNCQPTPKSYFFFSFCFSAPSPCPSLPSNLHLFHFKVLFQNQPHNSRAGYTAETPWLFFVFIHPSHLSIAYHTIAYHSRPEQSLT